MSTVPKRSHEEGGHSSSSTKYHPPEEGSSYPNVAFDTGQDSRVGKVSRADPRDTDRRSPLQLMYRVPSSSMNDSHINRLVVCPDNRLESRDPKEIRDNKVENRDAKAESKEPHHHSSKTEKDVRLEGRGDDNKEVKYERETHNDPKSVMKPEKDSYGTANSQPNWKEHHKGKRYPDAPSGAGSLDPWANMRPSAHGTPDVGKEGLISEERRHVEVKETIGENKPDLKGDDKYKDKDRKKKEGKQREWGEREKDRSDRKTNLQVSTTGNDSKEPAREERESERCEKERKDILKEKEREKDFSNKETWNAMEKEGSQLEKEIVDRPSMLDNLALEQKSTKETGAWKNTERESRERRKERDGDMEGERPEKRSRLNDKEFDEGVDGVEGATERDRDAFNCAVQQRKRMLRPRDSPQRASRFRSRSQDVDGSQGKAEVSSVVYRVGECMQELIKLWKEYESSQADKNSESAYKGPTLEIQIPAEHVTATNRQVRCGQLWGTDIYTNDSDLVAVLMHTGYCRPTAMPPPSAIQELRATVQVLPPQDSYVSTLRNNVRSRAWGAAIGCSYRVECCCIVKKGGGTIDLEPCLTHTSTVEPTLAPVAVERTMTTRAAASNALRQQRFVREVTIQYNLCNEPWIKYSISIVADKGLKKPLYTSARLKKGEVLYLETHFCRYELCFAGEKVVKAPTASFAHESDVEKSQNHSWHHMNGDRSLNECDSVIDVFRWSKCKRPLPQNVMRSIGIPLPTEHVEVLEENLDWEDILWSQTGVWISGKEYQLARVHFLSPN